MTFRVAEESHILADPERLVVIPTGEDNPNATNGLLIRIADAAGVVLYPGWAGGPLFLLHPEAVEDQIALLELLDHVGVNYYAYIGSPYFNGKVH